MTFSPKVFIPLTMLCRDRCGYCTFAKARRAWNLRTSRSTRSSRSPGPAGRPAATKPSSPSARDPRIATRRPASGWRPRFASTVDYLEAACRAVLEETGLLPHANAGALDAEALIRLRSVAASQGMMVESLNPDLAAHRSAPDKTPARGLATLEAAGTSGVPFTTGLLVGIGESRAIGWRRWRRSPPAIGGTAMSRK